MEVVYLADPLVRCDNGHYYDSKKHSSCPFCGVAGLDFEPKKTQAKKPDEPLDASIPAQGTDEGKTVGLFRKKAGINPVVGWLVSIEGPERGRDFKIVAEKNFIGRSEKMDISISGDDSVSRENHAIISFNPLKCIFRLFTGDSHGLVYLNEEEVVTPVELKANDVIVIGKSKLMFIPFCGENFIWSQSDSE